MQQMANLDLRREYFRLGLYPKGNLSDFRGQGNSKGTGSGNVSFGLGDLVIFPNGLKCTWQVVKAVKKHYNFE
jgi:hypothetical protein